jgi:hypothetical protein
VASRTIDPGLACAGLLTHVSVSKYADYQPLYRQSEIYAGEGVGLHRTTLAEWGRPVSSRRLAEVDSAASRILIPSFTTLLASRLTSMNRKSRVLVIVHFNPHVKPIHHRSSLSKQD